MQRLRRRRSARRGARASLRRTAAWQRTYRAAGRHGDLDILRTTGDDGLWEVWDSDAFGHVVVGGGDDLEWQGG